MYSNVQGETIEEYVKNAKQKVDQGFTALKFSVSGPAEIIDGNKLIDRYIYVSWKN